MKKSTKLVSMFLSLVMVFSMFGTLSVSAVWDDEQALLNPALMNEYQKYMQFEGNTLVKYTGTNSRVISIPAGTEIGDGAFKDHTEIHEVRLHTSISKIGKEAFKGCTNLEVVLGNGVAVIGDSAFEDCSKLFGYMYFIGDDVFTKPTYFSIGKAAFKNCTNLREFGFYIPNIEVKAETFANCPKLKSIDFAKNPAKIDPATFSTITNNGKTVTRTSNPVIHAEVGTVAEAFAKKYGMQFSTEPAGVRLAMYVLMEEYAVPVAPKSIFSHKIPNPKYNPELAEKNHGSPIYSDKYKNEFTEGRVNSYEMRNFTYYVLRDVAAECNKLDATKFNIEYMPEKKAVNIVFGESYVPNGSEYQGYDKYAYVDNTSVTKMPLYFNGHASNLFAYNIGGKACIILDDFLWEMNSPYEINKKAASQGEVQGATWLNLGDDHDAFNRVNQK